MGVTWSSIHRAQVGQGHTQDTAGWQSCILCAPATCLSFGPCTFDALCYWQSSQNRTQMLSARECHRHNQHHWLKSHRLCMKYRTNTPADATTGQLAIEASEAQDHGACRYRAFIHWNDNNTNKHPAPWAMIAQFSLSSLGLETGSINSAVPGQTSGSLTWRTPWR